MLLKPVTEKQYGILGLGQVNLVCSVGRGQDLSTRILSMSTYNFLLGQLGVMILLVEGRFWFGLCPRLDPGFPDGVKAGGGTLKVNYPAKCLKDPNCPSDIVAEIFAFVGQAAWCVPERDPEEDSGDMMRICSGTREQLSP